MESKQAMESSEHCPDRPLIQSLCEVGPTARKLLRQQGPLREYEASELHLQIYRQFKAEHVSDCFDMVLH